MSRPPQDPRHRNEVFSVDSAQAYLARYRKGLDEALGAVDGAVLDQVHAQMLRILEADRLLFVAGNGGSAAIAEQLSCDWMKSTRVAGGKVLRVVCLSNNASLGSAISNDFGYEYLFEQQLEMYASPGDMVVLVSSSGNSPNIVRAARYSLANDLFLVGLTGFSGGKLAELAQLSIHVPVHNYGIVEDAHQAVTHVLAQYMAAYRDRHA